MEGVVAIFLCKNGRVIATSTDFEKGYPTGFTQKEFQAVRAKAELKRKVVEAYSSPAMTELLSDYAYDVIFKDLIQAGGKIHYEYIGYGVDQ